MKSRLINSYELKYILKISNYNDQNHINISRTPVKSNMELFVTFVSAFSIFDATGALDLPSM